MNSLEKSSFFQLTATRFRLYAREPEAIFWTFVFPILLAVGLGIAFRNRPADVLPVGATTVQLTQALAADKGLTAATLDEAAGTHALATGRILLLAIQRPGENPGGGSLAHAAGSGEQVGVAHATGGDGVGQRAGDVLLPHQFVECLGAVTSGDDHIGRGIGRTLLRFRVVGAGHAN